MKIVAYERWNDVKVNVSIKSLSFDSIQYIEKIRFHIREEMPHLSAIKCNTVYPILNNYE